MTQVTPPGWYPDPGQKNDGPATERWWDGRAWTDQTRPAGSATAGGPPAPEPTDGALPVVYSEGAYPEGVPPESGYGGYDGAAGYNAYAAYPPPPGAATRGGLRTGIAVAAAVAVLTAIGIGVYVLSDEGGSGGGTTAQAPDNPGQSGGQSGGQGDPFGGSGGGSGDSGGSSGGLPTPEESEAPKIKSGSVTDSANGISIPIPDGWYGQEGSTGAAVTSESSYKCPGDTSKSCTEGGVYSSPATLLGTEGDTAEEVAKADISDNAEDSYGGNVYGEITSHQVLASKSVTVAGQKGYMVRWKAVTSKGADGYVESLVFPSPTNTDQLVVLRFGVDADQDVSVIDDITKGIKKASGSGGSGQDV